MKAEHIRVIRKMIQDGSRAVTHEAAVELFLEAIAIMLLEQISSHEASKLLKYM